MEDTETFTNLIQLLRNDNHFPKLAELDLRFIEEMSGRQWENIVLGMKDRIKSFSLAAFNTSSTMMFSQIMTNHWSHTLETLKIEPDNITSEDIQRILTSCAKLKKFYCLCPWLIMTIRTLRNNQEIPGLKTIVRGDSTTRNDEMPDWVCLDLEELKLTFSDARSITAEEPALLQQELWTAQGIKRVYQQLGRLSKLEELTIGWCSDSTFSQRANLDMTLNSGLDQMKGLKSMKMIDISFIAKVNSGMQEAEWMLENWPSLRSISGLSYRYRKRDWTLQTPDYINFLRSERRTLIVT
ncbi:hypothetical protein BGZ65_012877 [Modicella reniformis]|uniref:Uncharacterized protein n=1 Tax=Modicella reniformis TaxID=1440133 RepID=A0A9P6J629_9FUNG|nr:hypothetical protein BGZ65_012877 [Modicella reniformis]